MTSTCIITRRYSRGQLRERIERAGYKIDKLTYTNAALFPVAVLARVADRLRGSGSASGLSLPPAPVNAAMKAMFSAESLIVPNASLAFRHVASRRVRQGRGRGAARRPPGGLSPMRPAGGGLIDGLWSLRLSRFAAIGASSTLLYAGLRFRLHRPGHRRDRSFGAGLPARRGLLLCAAINM